MHPPLSAGAAAPSVAAVGGRTARGAGRAAARAAARAPRDGAALAGGDPEQNAAITRAVLGGDKGAPRDIVCLNAAAAIVASGTVDDLAAGWETAQGSIDGGKAMAALEGLVEGTKEG